MIVAEKSAFPKLAEIFAETPVSVWRDYLTVHYLHAFAAYLPKKFDDENFAFYGTVVAGQHAAARPRHARRASARRRYRRGAGQALCRQIFPARSQGQGGRRSSHNLLKAYAADIQTLAWMTPETREKALEKLHQIHAHIGYPDKWRDYSALVISRDDLVGDVKNANDFEWNRELKRLDDPVDKTEWGMTPPTVNAYYDPVVQRDRVPGRDPAAALLRSQCGRCGELRRHRRGDRPRNQPRLRRSGLEIQRRRRAAELVDAGRPQELRRAHRRIWSSSSIPTNRCRACM